MPRRTCDRDRRSAGTPQIPPDFFLTGMLVARSQGGRQESRRQETGTPVRRLQTAEFRMLDMRLDHLSYAAAPDGLAATARRIGGLLGKDFTDGGIHPRFGTRNMVLPLADSTYLEVVEVLDHPASDKAPFGQAVRARSASGGGWLGWVVAVDDIAPVEQRLGREAVIGSRHRPDGTELRWKQIGVNGLIADPQLPFFIQWEVAPELHPSHGADGAFSLATLEIA